MTELLDVLVPVLVAIVTVVGSIMVAKIGKMEKAIKTNHGTKCIGDATDKILTEVRSNTEQLRAVARDVGYLRKRDDLLDERMLSYEQRLQGFADRELEIRKELA